MIRSIILEGLVLSTLEFFIISKERHDNELLIFGVSTDISPELKPRNEYSSENLLRISRYSEFSMIFDFSITLSNSSTGSGSFALVLFDFNKSVFFSAFLREESFEATETLAVKSMSSVFFNNIIRLEREFFENRLFFSWFQYSLI